MSNGSSAPTMGGKPDDRANEPSTLLALDLVERLEHVDDLRDDQVRQKELLGARED
jgi:hypothetical protein